MMWMGLGNHVCGQRLIGRHFVCKLLPPCSLATLPEGVSQGACVTLDLSYTLSECKFKCDLLRRPIISKHLIFRPHWKFIGQNSFALADFRTTVAPQSESKSDVPFAESEAKQASIGGGEGKDVSAGRCSSSTHTTHPLSRKGTSNGTLPTRFYILAALHMLTFPQPTELVQLPSSAGRFLLTSEVKKLSIEVTIEPSHLIN